MREGAEEESPELFSSPQLPGTFQAWMRSLPAVQSGGEQAGPHPAALPCWGELLSITSWSKCEVTILQQKFPFFPVVQLCQLTVVFKWKEGQFRLDVRSL